MRDLFWITIFTSIEPCIVWILLSTEYFTFWILWVYYARTHCTYTHWSEYICCDNTQIITYSESSIKRHFCQINTSCHLNDIYTRMRVKICVIVRNFSIFSIKVRSNIVLEFSEFALFEYQELLIAKSFGSTTVSFKCLWLINMEFKYQSHRKYFKVQMWTLSTVNIFMWCNNSWSEP